MHPATRRTFLASLSGLLGVSVAPGNVLARTSPLGEWDVNWLDRLSGKHKQLFDVGATDSLKAVRNWLEAHRDVFGTEHTELSALVGIAGDAFPINAGDELFKKYPIGEEWKITDPETKKPAERNIFLDGGATPKDRAATVRALQAKGVIFWQCNNALKRIAHEFAVKVNRPDEDVYAELRAGLNPGVILVPAHVMFVGLAQEKGCCYEKL